MLSCSRFEAARVATAPACITPVFECTPLQESKNGFNRACDLAS